MKFLFNDPANTYLQYASTFNNTVPVCAFCFSEKITNFTVHTYTKLCKSKALKSETQFYVYSYIELRFAF
jgi:hypothetical protein